MKKLKYKIILFILIALISNVFMSIILDIIGIFIFGKEIAKNNDWIDLVSWGAAIFALVCAEIFSGLIRYFLNDFQKS